MGGWAATSLRLLLYEYCAAGRYREAATMISIAFTAELAAWMRTTAGNAPEGTVRRRMHDSTVHFNHYPRD